MAEDSIAQMELREKDGAPLPDGNLNSPNGHLTQAGSFLSSGGSGSKASPNPADCYWFAQSGDSPSETKQPPERDGVDQDGKDSNFNKDREERVRVLREKQAEERHRKLEELKSAAMQAQKFREIQEEERRRKIEEIKYKDSERRHLVEERKRQIWEAEKDRRETILRKSQEREARIEAVRNSQRSSIGFAFGSSIPRLYDLETSLMVGRRSSSQTNVTLSPTTPNSRSAVNDQADGEVVKKRTTSAYSLDHRNSDSGENLMTQSMSALSASIHRGRRKTDLIPTMPPSRHSPRTRSPAPASPTRPQSSMSQLSLSSHTSQSSTVSLRARSTPRRPRPMSVAGTIPDKQLSNEERQSRSSEKRAATPLSSKPPRAKSVGADQVPKEMGNASNKPAVAPSPASRRPPPAGGRTPAAKGTTNTPKEKPKIAPKPAIFRQNSKPSPAQSPPLEQQYTPSTKDLSNKVSEPSKPLVEPEPIGQIDKENVSETPEVAPLPVAPCEPSKVKSENGKRNGTDELVKGQSLSPPLIIPEPMEPSQNFQSAKDPIVETQTTFQPKQEIKEKIPKEISAVPVMAAQQEEAAIIDLGQTPSKPKITTEEEAKAALAEKRRLAREQAEREAELERQRQEELCRQEEERIRREEEEQRLWEIEQERSRHAEEERLRKAIEEQQQREEEERLRKEDEAKQKIEKEKAERLAREEQEKIRKETEEKLRKEDEERAERRKRVEAIMSRTRGKGGTNTPPVTTPTKSTELVLPVSEQHDSNASSTSITDSVEQNGEVDGSTMEMLNESQVLAQPDLLGNIANTEMDKVNASETSGGKQVPLIEQQFATKIETILKEEHDVVESIHTNGFSHREVVSSQTDADLIMDSQSTPEKKLSPLSDNLVEFDLLASNQEPTAPPEMAQLIDISLGTLHTTTEITTTTRSEVEHVTNEDNVNFNIATNGLDSPFVDNYTRHQESTVTDFLS